MNDQQRRHEAILKLIHEYTIEHTRSREIARAALIREGIYTEDGELAPGYHDYNDFISA